MRLTLILLLFIQLNSYAQVKPLRVGVAGLTHGHVHWILQAVRDKKVELTGIAESNKDLAQRLMKQYGIDPSYLYPDLSSMVEQTKPEAVTAFGSIYDHLGVVKICAPRGIHVMVEKPLAVNLEHAKEMEALAKKHKIHLLTNFETTWYQSHQEAYETIRKDPQAGDIVKLVIHDGHQGPKEIGVNKEFLEWLTDPKLNGGGAITDFGCYGANLATWFMDGARPISVFAVTQQIKPDIYPRVDDEATIIVTYPKAQAIIQASWNWPYGRKDIEIYTKNRAIIADREKMRMYWDASGKELVRKTPQREPPYNDPFLFLTAVVKGQITLGENDLSGLHVNMIAMEILDAAVRSAREGKIVKISNP